MTQERLTRSELSTTNTGGRHRARERQNLVNSMPVVLLVSVPSPGSTDGQEDLPLDSRSTTVRIFTSV